MPAPTTTSSSRSSSTSSTRASAPSCAATPAAPSRVLAHGGVTLDPAQRRVTLNGAPVLLSAREFAVLEALMARPGAVLSRAQLEDRLYGWGEEIESNAVSVYIHQLRKKLGADFIRNVRGVGYFVDATAPAPADELDPPAPAGVAGRAARARRRGDGGDHLPQRPRRDRGALRLPAAADGAVAARPGRDRLRRRPDRWPTSSSTS